MQDDYYDTEGVVDINATLKNQSPNDMKTQKILAGDTGQNAI